MTRKSCAVGMRNGILRNNLKTYHNFKAPIKVLILDIGCFHHDIPFANNIYTLSDTIPSLENTPSGGLPVVVLQGLRIW